MAQAGSDGVHLPGPEVGWYRWRMAIRWHFDRNKLTPREAQLVDALIDVGSLTLALVATVTHHTDTAETAETLRQRLDRALPDLGFRFEVLEDPPGGSR